MGADKSREENFEHAVRRLDELDGRLRSAHETMTVEAIERDRWNAVKLDIPQDASLDLLGKIAETARDLRDDAFGYVARASSLEEEAYWDGLYAKADERFEHASTRIAELDARLEPAAAEKVPMTVEVIERDPWNAVDRELPANADRTFLATAAVAAEQCEKFAFAAARVGEVMEPELVEFYQERRADAAERRDEAWRQFTVRPPEQGSQMRLLNPEQMQDRAMSSLHEQAHEHREAAGQGAEITHEALDKNPWVVLTGSLSEFDDRELLDRIDGTLHELRDEATQRRAAAVSPEEAELWRVRRRRRRKPRRRSARGNGEPHSPRGCPARAARKRAAQEG